MNEAQTRPEISIYEADGGRVEVRLTQDTVWLTQAQMADVFETSTDNIGLHLKNIYTTDEELDEAATTEDFSVVRQEGKRRVQRRLKHYNLDAIISVGYRVSSNEAGIRAAPIDPRATLAHPVFGAGRSRRCSSGRRGRGKLAVIASLIRRCHTAA